MLIKIGFCLSSVFDVSLFVFFLILSYWQALALCCACLRNFCWFAATFILIIDHCLQNLKNEIKQRESVWSAVHWELIEPIVKIRTLRARMVSATYGKCVL